jgi:hypothetical protein
MNVPNPNDKLDLPKQAAQEIELPASKLPSVDDNKSVKQKTTHDLNLPSVSKITNMNSKQLTAFEI